MIHVFYSHVVFSPSVSETHISDMFSGFVDLLTRIGNQSEILDPSTWNKIKQHIAAVSFLIGEAARSLNEDF